jgi:GR25 family glycosyltransferase involved in LPS biosynthesis
MINKIVDNTYVLNLKDDKFKYNILKRKLDKLNIKHKRFEAVNGKEMEKEYTALKNKRSENLNKLYKNKNYDSNILKIIKIRSNQTVFRSYGSFGCLLSYIKILEDAIKNKYNKILLLQDDIYFYKKFNTELSNILNDIEIFNSLYLGASEWGNPQISKNYYNPSFRTTGLFGVILDKQIFEKSLELMKYYCLPADVCVSVIINSYYLDTSYVLYPNLIIADTTKSRTTIDRPLEKHSKKMNWNLENYDMSEMYYKLVTVFGDSHARIFNKLNIKNLLINCNYISGASITGLPRHNSTLETKDKIIKYLKYNNCDYLILKFGQVDIDLGYYYKLVVKDIKISKESYIINLICNYSIFIKSLLKYISKSKIIIFGINPPSLISKSKCFEYTKKIVLDDVKLNNNLYDLIESVEIRTKFSYLFNIKCKEFCKKENIRYTEVYKDFLNEKGIVSNKFTNDNNHHLNGIKDDNDNCTSTNELFEKCLLNIIGNKY